MGTEDEIETPGHLPDLGEVGTFGFDQSGQAGREPAANSPEPCRFPVISFVVSAFTLEDLS